MRFTNILEDDDAEMSSQQFNATRVTLLEDFEAMHVASADDSWYITYAPTSARDAYIRMRDLVALLSFADVTVVRNAVRDIAESTEEQIQIHATANTIIDAHGFIPLITLLRSADIEILRYALRALTRFPCSNDDQVLAWLPARFVELLSSTDVEIKRYTAKAIAHSVGIRPAQIHSVGGTHLLIALLSSDELETKCYAVQALRSIVIPRFIGIDVVAATPNIIPLLVELLSSADKQTRCDVLELVHALTFSDEFIDSSIHKDVMCETNTIMLLLTLVRTANNDAQFYATRILANLTNGSEENKNVIRQTSAIEVLVGVISSSASILCKRDALEALEFLVLDNFASQDQIRECNGLAVLLALLDERPLTEKVMRCLLNIIENNPNNQEALRSGIPMLVRLLRPISDFDSDSEDEMDYHIARYAALAMYYLSFNHLNQQVIVDAGGVPALIDLMNAPDPDDEYESVRYATYALSSLAEHASVRAVLCTAHVIRKFVALFTSTDDEKTADYAILALAILAEQPTGQDAIRIHNAIAPLVSMLNSQLHAADSQRVQDLILGLCNLVKSRRNAEIIREANGEASLKVILSSTTDAETKQYAITALNRMSFYYAEQLLRENNEEGAISEYTAILARSPREIAALIRRASIYKAQHDYAQALADYNTVLTLNPYHQNALNEIEKLNRPNNGMYPW